MSFNFEMMKKCQVKERATIRLSKLNCEDTYCFKGGKEQAAEELQKQHVLLEDLQSLLYAEHKHKVLIVLQAMDTAGKDSTIRMVFQGVNPQGVRVASFKVPSAEEADHDYLWRAHQKVPAKGEIVIFNRSHYEDVLVDYTHHLVSQQELKERYAQINDFEHMLTQEGTTILKFFLHIDKDEQKKRLLERLHDPKKQWKLSLADVAERKLWPKYIKAYEHMLAHTSTSWAPWYIIPANKKWYRNILVASIITSTLRQLNMKYPKPKDDLRRIVIV
ncbi:MAG: polyphosphate kinase 2 family protein [Candidatus Omnitrophica bacterium]|nr:polyphosphate kinase 2 family protein [Candidatus Omnitrophota bacterium]